MKFHYQNFALIAQVCLHDYCPGKTVQVPVKSFCFIWDQLPWKIAQYIDVISSDMQTINLAKRWEAATF